MRTDCHVIKLELGVEERDTIDRSSPVEWLEARARRRMALARAFLAEDDWLCDQVRALLADADALRSAAGITADGGTVEFIVAGDPQSVALLRAQIANRAHGLASLENRPDCRIASEIIDELDWMLVDDMTADHRCADDSLHELELHFGVPSDHEEPGAATAADLISFATSRLALAVRVRAADINHDEADYLLDDVEALQAAAFDACHGQRVRIRYSTSTEERHRDHARVMWILCEHVARGDFEMVSEDVIRDFQFAAVESLEAMADARGEVSA
ncbi:MAG: hypothetical protein NXI30_05905 [bacterium]|nr:hypothetical protein [bacterium]